jgi:DNA helicase-2/ATP-dependent DNA helicase PcrA
MQILSKYNQNFQKALERLNENQLKAVNQIDGPVLVIAGPGTGKTQILAARIGKILTETDTQAHNILCLTYTDAGTVAMRKRLFDFIGPDAYRVNIYTFHAFCNYIIQENLDYFGKLELDPISDLERIDLFRKLVDGFPPNHLLKRFRGDVYYEIKRLQELFSIMKREGWSPEIIDKKIAEYIDEVENCEPDSPYYKTFKYVRKYKANEAGSLKPEFSQMREDMDKLCAAVNEFKAYQALMMKMSRYDYDDMILWVLDAFKKDENFLLNYQERYQYVLVDEFQDTSGAQNELINLLISYWDKPNIFVVGDDDQSIFRFQGANVQNIEEYNSRYSDSLYRVMLTDNYRSSQIVLDVARELIKHNTERINLPGLSKHLVAQNDRYAGVVPHPQIMAYSSQFNEFADITHEVGLLLQSGVPPEEIAIIYKEHRSGQELARFFQLKGIPVHTKRKVNILKEPFGRKLINILRYLAFESQFPFSGDELLFEIMHYDFYQIAPIDIAKISVEVSEYNKSHNNKTSIRAKISDISRQTAQTLFDTESRKQIKRLSDDLEFWIKESNNLTIQGLFEKIMVRGGILAYILSSADKTWYMQAISSLFNFLKEESRKKPDMKLKDMVALIDLLEENDISIEVNQIIFNEQGVNFLTCHGSKGLEFEYVYLIGANTNVWEKKKKLSSTYKFPDNLFASSPSSNNDEELRRLFYVAITRAKKFLTISYPAQDANGKELEPTLFLGEILSRTDLQVNRKEVSESILTDFFILQFAQDERPSIGLIDKQYVESLLQNYVLSSTHLNNYLDCPLKFYFQNLIMVPSGKNESMTFGSAVHSALNKLFSSLAEDKKEFHGVSKFVEDFQWYMKRNREAFTNEQFKRRMEYGDKILPDFYNKYISHWEKYIVAEYRISNVEIEGVPVKGVLDKLEFRGNDVNIVDYKTGSFEYAKKKLSPPNEKDPLGGDYWRQAVFYKLLVDNDRRNNWKAIGAEFDFVEPYKNEYIKKKVDITADDLSLVKEQIKETYGRILDHEFSGCGKEECQWCTFVRTNFKEPQDILEKAAEEENEFD